MIILICVYFSWWTSCTIIYKKLFYFTPCNYLADHSRTIQFELKQKSGSNNKKNQQQQNTKKSYTKSHNQAMKIVSRGHIHKKIKCWYSGSRIFYCRLLSSGRKTFWAFQFLMRLLKIMRTKMLNNFIVIMNWRMLDETNFVFFVFAAYRWCSLVRDAARTQIKKTQNISKE